MNAKGLSVVSLSLFVLSFVAVAPADAQPPRLRLQNRSYNVTIVSEFGIPVRVGIFGYSTKAQARIDFDGGRTGPDVYDQELFAGERVICVWDPRGRALLVASVLIDSDGMLVLAPYFAGQAAAAVAGDAPPAAANGEGENDQAAPGIPRLKIKPKE